MIWFVMILTGFINFIFRISMFSGIRNIHLPLSLNRYVVYVPTSVLSAIIASSLISFNGQEVLYEAEKSLQNLHGVLYHQINKYGSAYLDQMKQFDAGLYSVSDIDEKIDFLHEQTNYLVDLLQKEVEPNNLVKDFAP